MCKFEKCSKTPFNEGQDGNKLIPVRIRVISQEYILYRFVNHGLLCTREKLHSLIDWHFVNSNGSLHKYLNWLVCPIWERGEAVMKDLCVTRVRRVVRHVCATRVKGVTLLKGSCPGEPRTVRQMKDLEIANIR